MATISQVSQPKWTTTSDMTDMVPNKMTLTMHNTFYILEGFTSVLFLYNNSLNSCTNVMIKLSSHIDFLYILLFDLYRLYIMLTENPEEEQGPRWVGCKVAAQHSLGTTKLAN